MTLEEYIIDANHHFYTMREEVGDYRRGQAYFNALPPDIARKIAGTEYDPFYRDALIPVFLNRVQELLSGE